MSKPKLIPEAAPIKAAFARLSSSRQHGYKGIPQPLSLSEILQYSRDVLGIRHRQEREFVIDVLQTLDSMWLNKAYEETR